MQSIKSISLLDHLNFFSPPTSVHISVLGIWLHSSFNIQEENKNQNKNRKYICISRAFVWMTPARGSLLTVFSIAVSPGRVEEHCAVCDCALGDELQMMCQSLKTSTQKL